MAEKSALREFIESFGSATPPVALPPGNLPADGAAPAPPMGGAGAAPGAAAPPGPGVQGGAAAAAGLAAQGGAAGPAGLHAGASPEKAFYDKELAAVTKLRTDLGAHKQAAHVADKTSQADAALTAAAAFAATPDWHKAMAELAKARKACVDGKGFADKFAEFLTKRAEANLVLTAAQTSGWTLPPALPALLPSADAKAAPGVRNYAGAKTDLDGIITGLAPLFKKFYVDNVKPKIAALKALPEAKFITAEIAEIDKLMAEQVASIAAKQWRKVSLNNGLIDDRLDMATKIATRRKTFDAERPKADAAVKALQAHNATTVAAPLARIQQRLKDADTMASKSGMQFEDATKEVEAIIKDCGTFSHLAHDAEAYSKQRGTLAGELAALRKHAAADKIKAELDVVSGLLDEAVKAAGDTGAPGAALVLSADASKHDLVTANARLTQARTDLANAHKLADGLGGVAAVENSTKGKGDPAELTKGAEALAKVLAAARKAPHADLAKAELDAAKAALDDVKKKIDAKQPDAAAQALTTAEEKLTAAARSEIEHARFVERNSALTKRLEQLKGDKGQAEIKPKIDALAKALADANAAETSKDRAKAMAFLDTAETAAGAADAALVARTAFDKEAKEVQTDLDKPAYASIKAAQTAQLQKARDLANAFDFAAAEKALKAIGNEIGGADTETMARKTPPDPHLAEKAKKLADAGGTKELDDLIKKLPNNVDIKVFIALAQARFKGVTFKAESGVLMAGAVPISGNEQDGIKRMCNVMKDIPADVVNNNPSLKKINRRLTDPQNPAKLMGGPYYAPSDTEVVMNSAQETQTSPDFGPGKAAGFLPARDPNCQPANDNPENMFDWNMVHELAHSIDDATNYMGQNGSKADHGGWAQHGGDVNPIVEAVIKETGFGKTAEERKYVLDRILRNPAVPPTTFAGDKVKFENFVNAAQQNNVWDSQALSVQATMDGRVYHEAYPNTWVSYLADARKRGITSYQFRAPGEWFAELYSAWKAGKLQANHPAVAWLSKLKV